MEIGFDKEKLLNQIKGAKVKIKELIREDSLVFPIITDLHTQNANFDFSRVIADTLKAVTSEIKADALINLGDNLSMLGRYDKITNDNLKKIFVDLFNLIYENINCPIIAVNGNHDAIGTDFFKADFWNSIIKGKYGNENAVYADEGSYYYIDYEKAKTRLIILSMPYDSDLEAENPTPLWGFGKKQLNWLKTIALNTEYDIIILNHAPFYYEYTGGETKLLEVFTGDRVAYSHYANLCGWIDDRDEAVEILKNSRGRVVCCLSGHTHMDSLWKSGEEKGGYKNTLPCYQVVTGSACIPDWEASTFKIRIDIAVWTPSLNELNMIRIGEGEDRKISV